MLGWTVHAKDERGATTGPSIRLTAADLWNRNAPGVTQVSNASGYPDVYVASASTWLEWSATADDRQVLTGWLQGLDPEDRVTMEVWDES